MRLWASTELFAGTEMAFQVCHHSHSGTEVVGSLTGAQHCTVQSHLIRQSLLLKLYL